jgi:hypothetical protein
MMDWAASVYHAISIANGGAYILGYERDRRSAMAEDPSADASGKLETSKKEEEEREAAAKSAKDKLDDCLADASWDKIAELEEAIREAEAAGVDATAAKKILAELRLEKVQVDEALKQLEDATATNDPATIEAAIKVAEGLGLREQCEQARRLLSDIKAKEMEAVLRRVASEATVDDYDELEKTIELAKASKVDVNKIVEAHGILVQLKTRRSERSALISQLKAAQVEREIVKLRHVLKACKEANITDEEEEVRSGEALLVILEREAFEAELATRAKRAHVEDIEEIERAIEEALRRGASVACLDAARARLAELLALRERREEVARMLLIAVEEESIEKLIAGLAAAEECGLLGNEVVLARATLHRLQAVSKT